MRKGVVKGMTRRGAGVVSMDDSGLKVVKQQRELKKNRDRMEAEMARMRAQIDALTARVLALESK